MHDHYGSQHNDVLTNSNAVCKIARKQTTNSHTRNIPNNKQKVNNYKLRFLNTNSKIIPKY